MGALLKVNEELNVRVWNDGERVFEGTVKDFVEINQYDEETIDFVNELENNKEFEQVFAHSGEWRIKKLQ
jgi:hypothetical protein